MPNQLSNPEDTVDKAEMISFRVTLRRRGARLDPIQRRKHQKPFLILRFLNQTDSCRRHHFTGRLCPVKRLEAGAFTGKIKSKRSPVIKKRLNELNGHVLRSRLHWNQPVRTCLANSEVLKNLALLASEFAELVLLQHRRPGKRLDGRGSIEDVPRKCLETGPGHFRHDSHG